MEKSLKRFKKIAACPQPDCDCL